MKKITKRKKMILEKIKFKKKYHIDEAINILKKVSLVKFIESFDVSINLGIDPKKSEQNIKGTVILPYGLGKPIKVAVFAQGENIQIAHSAGADLIGMEDLCKKIQKDGINFDVLIATPDTMHIVRQISSIIGPKGLMPNPKLGTVTNNIKNAIKNAKLGQIRYKNDKNGIVHTSIGKINFLEKNIKSNFYTLLDSLKKLKPNNSKGLFIEKIYFSTTMGPSIEVDHLI